MIGWIRQLVGLGVQVKILIDCKVKQLQRELVQEGQISIGKMQKNEMNWLHNKKSALLKEVIDLQLHTQKVYAEIDQAKRFLQQNLRQKEQALDELKRVSAGQICLLKSKTQKLENSLANKQQQTLQLSQSNSQLQLRNKALQVDVKRLSGQLEVLKNELYRGKEASEAKLKQQQMQQYSREQQRMEETVSKYEKLLAEKEQFYNAMYEREVEQIKTDNLRVIKLLEDKYESGITTQQTQADDQKRLQQEHTRLVQDHRGLLQQLATEKAHVLSLETLVSTQRQQNRLRQKQFQFKLQNSQKQVELFKETQSRLSAKNRSYAEKNEELYLQLQELQMRLLEQENRVKRYAQNQIAQVLDKCQLQVNDLKTQLSSLKTNELSPLLQQNSILTMALDTAKKQTTQLQAHSEQLQAEINRLNDQFSALPKLVTQNQTIKLNNLKKSQQIQVLDEQITRLKNKCNKLATACQHLATDNQTLQHENKMLLQQIVLLRHKYNLKKPKNYFFSSHPPDQNLDSHQKQQNVMEISGNNVLSIKSEVSQVYEDVQEYKEVIKELDRGMQQALGKLNEKDKLIQKQQSMIAKMERIIGYSN